MEKLKIMFIPRDIQNSEFDWVDIEYNNARVGKARCLINGNQFTIYSVNIYPEYQGNGYGRRFVEVAKLKYNEIIADRVRYNAIGFWEELGFVEEKETGNWIFKKDFIR